MSSFSYVRAMSLWGITHGICTIVRFFLDIPAEIV
jgi:hypothetical protein